MPIDESGFFFFLVVFPSWPVLVSGSTAPKGKPVGIGWVHSLSKVQYESECCQMKVVKFFSPNPPEHPG